MKVFKFCSYFFLYCAISACSSTSQVNSSIDNHEYYANNFSHTNFHTYQRDSIKKSAISDQMLLVSLLNRPIPEDQKMMLAFAARPNNYLPTGKVMTTEIKGDKRDNNRVFSAYAHIIDTDVNAMTISR